MVVKKELDAAGIKPALDPKQIGATFYCRSECFLTRVVAHEVLDGANPTVK